MCVKNGMAEATATAAIPSNGPQNTENNKQTTKYTHKIEMESNFHPRSLCL